MLAVKNINIINYYIKITLEQNLSYRQLQYAIKSKEYERLDEDAKLKLISNEEITLKNEIKHQIIIKNKYDTNDISEKMLKNLILENIDDFLLELGNGFSYIKSEYKIKTNTGYNYVDLLLFNITYNCYVKVTELKKTCRSNNDLHELY